MSAQAPDAGLPVCEGCDRVVEACAFCEERCGVEVCSRCLRVAIGEEIEEPHPHGG